MLFRNQAVFAVKNAKNRTFLPKSTSLFLNHVHLRSDEPRSQGKVSKEIHYVLVQKRFSIPFFLPSGSHGKRQDNKIGHP